MLLPPAIVAAGTVVDSLGREWDPIKHPRDRKGKFIHTFRRIKAFLTPDGTQPWATGQVEQVNTDGSIRMRVTHVGDPKWSNYIGELVDVSTDRLENVNEKATLSTPGKPNTEVFSKWHVNDSDMMASLKNMGLTTLEYNKARLALDRYQKNQNVHMVTNRDKYHLALYLRQLSADGKSNSRDDFMQTLDAMGVDPAVVDDTPDGMSGLAELMKLENSGRSPNINERDSIEWFNEVPPSSPDVAREAQLRDSDVHVRWYSDGTQSVVYPDGVEEQHDKAKGSLLQAAWDVHNGEGTTPKIDLPEITPGVTTPAESDLPESHTTSSTPLSQGEKDAGNAYSGASFFDINNALRFNSELSDQDYAHVQYLDSALAKSTLNEDIVLHRGMSRFDKIDPQFDSIVNSLKPGAEFEDLGFMSTSTDADKISEFLEPQGWIHFTINAKSGQNALDLEAHDLGNENESEILLPRGSKLKITSVEKDGDVGYRVIADLIEPEKPSELPGPKADLTPEAGDPEGPPDLGSEPDQADLEPVEQFTDFDRSDLDELEASVGNSSSEYAEDLGLAVRAVGDGLENGLLDNTEAHAQLTAVANDLYDESEEVEGDDGGPLWHLGDQVAEYANNLLGVQPDEEVQLHEHDDKSSLLKNVSVADMSSANGEVTDVDGDVIATFENTDAGVVATLHDGTELGPYKNNGEMRQGVADAHNGWAEANGLYEGWEPATDIAPSPETMVNENGVEEKTYPLPPKLYHATPPENENNIDSEGLVPGEESSSSQGRVHLSETPATSLVEALAELDPGTAVVYEVDTSGIRGIRGHDNDMHWTAGQNIPPSRLKKIKNTDAEEADQWMQDIIDAADGGKRVRILSGEYEGKEGLAVGEFENGNIRVIPDGEKSVTTMKPEWIEDLEPEPDLEAQVNAHDNDWAFPASTDIAGHWSDLDQWADLDVGAVTDQEAKRARLYSLDNLTVNSYLRSEQSNDFFDEQVAELDSLMDKSKTKQDMQVNRSVLGNKGEPHMDALLNAQPGDTFHDSGFSSTTTGNYSDGLPYGNNAADTRVRLKVNVPEGSSAFDANQVSWRKAGKPPPNNHEHELVLDRDGEFEVVSVEQGTGKTDRVITVNYHERPKEGTKEDSAVPADIGSSGEPDSKSAQLRDLADSILERADSFNKQDWADTLNWVADGNEAGNLTPEEVDTHLNDLATEIYEEASHNEDEDLNELANDVDSLTGPADPLPAGVPEDVPEEDVDVTTADEPDKKFEVLADPGLSGNGYFPNNDGLSLWGKYGAAGVMVRHVDEDGTERFLMVQRGPWLIGKNKDKWQLPGGALESKENAYQGSARELTEELSPPDDFLPGLTPVGEVKYEHESGWQYNNLAADSSVQFEPKVDGHETGDAGWFTREEIAKLVLHPALEKNIDALFNQFPQPEKKHEDVSDEPPAVDVPEAVSDVSTPPVAANLNDFTISESLNSGEKNALTLYGFAPGYKLINPYLHHDKHVFDTSTMSYRPATEAEQVKAEEAIKNLDTAFEKGTPLDHPVLVYRRSGAELFADGDMTGDTFQNLAYTSTQTKFTTYGYGYESKPVQWDITLPAGTKALKGNAHENEVLLPRGGQFEVTSDTMQGGVRHLAVTYHPAHGTHGARKLPMEQEEKQALGLPEPEEVPPGFQEALNDVINEHGETPLPDEPDVNVDEELATWYDEHSEGVLTNEQLAQNIQSLIEKLPPGKLQDDLVQLNEVLDGNVPPSSSGPTLTPDQHDVLNEYQSASLDLNDTLREIDDDGDVEFVGDLGHAVEVLDDLVNSDEVPTGTKLYRGLNPGDDPDTYAAFLVTVKPGAIIEEKSYMSTSGDLSVAQNFLENANDFFGDSILFEIDAPEGTKAFHFDSHPDFAEGEDEYLLGRHTKLKIQGVVKHDDGYLIAKASIVTGDEEPDSEVPTGVDDHVPAPSSPAPPNTPDEQPIAPWEQELLEMQDAKFESAGSIKGGEPGPSSTDFDNMVDAGGPYRWHPSGIKVRIGMTVKSQKDGLEGTIHKFEKNHDGVVVLGTDGKKRGRKIKTLDITGSVGNTLPSPASPATSAPPLVPDLDPGTQYEFEFSDEDVDVYYEEFEEMAAASGVIITDIHYETDSGKELSWTVRADGTTLQNFWLQVTEKDIDYLKKYAAPKSKPNAALDPAPAPEVTAAPDLQPIRDKIPKNIAVVKAKFPGLNDYQAKQLRNAGFAMDDMLEAEPGSPTWKKALEKAKINLDNAGLGVAPLKSELLHWENKHNNPGAVVPKTSVVSKPGARPSVKGYYGHDYTKQSNGAWTSPTGPMIEAGSDADKDISKYADDDMLLPPSAPTVSAKKSGPYGVDSKGDAVFVGDKVQSLTDGEIMTLYKFEKNGTGAVFIDVDGKKKARKLHKVYNLEVDAAPYSSSGNMPNTKNVAGTSIISTKKHYEPDPSSPWYGKDQPKTPAPLEEGDQQLVSDEWLAKADANYKKNKVDQGLPVKDLKDAHGYYRFVETMNGNKTSLETLHSKGYITPELYHDALDQITENTKKVLDKKNAYNEALKKWREDTKAWRAANGLPALSLRGMDDGVHKWGTEEAKKWMNQNQPAGKLGPNGKLSQTAEYAVEAQKDSNQSSGLRALKEKSLNSAEVKKLFNYNTIYGLDQAMQESEPVKEDFITIRTFATDAFVDPDTGEQFKQKGTISNIVGTIQHDWGFAETAPGSLEKGSTPGYHIGNVQMELRVPAGTRGVWTLTPGYHFGAMSERGFILERGIAYYIHSVEYFGGKWHVKAEIIPKDEVNYDEYGHFINENPFFD